MIEVGTNNVWFILPCITTIYDPNGENSEIGFYFLNVYLIIKL